MFTFIPFSPARFLAISCAELDDFPTIAREYDLCKQYNMSTVMCDYVMYLSTLLQEQRLLVYLYLIVTCLHLHLVGIPQQQLVLCLIQVVVQALVYLVLFQEPLQARDVLLQGILQVESYLQERNSNELEI